MSEVNHTKKFIPLIVCGAAIAALLYGQFVFDSKPTESTPSDTMNYEDECEALLSKGRNVGRTQFYPRSQWWKDHKKVYLYDIHEVGMETEQRLCVVDPAKGLLFSPSVFNQEQYL